MISKEEFEKQKKERLDKENYNNQGMLMKIIEYNGVRDIVVEFQDEYKDVIPQKLYDAMYRWEVEIND